MRKKQGYDSSIGVRIKKAREDAGYTQEKLAELTDVGVQYLAKLETGKVGISLPNFMVFCRVLGVSADYLLWGERKENNTIAILDRIRFMPDKQFKLLEKNISNFLEAIRIAENKEDKEKK